MVNWLLLFVVIVCIMGLVGENCWIIIVVLMINFFVCLFINVLKIELGFGVKLKLIIVVWFENIWVFCMLFLKFLVLEIIW